MPLGTAAAAGEGLVTSDESIGDLQGWTQIDDEVSKFGKTTDIWFMTIMVAFLMMFIRKFEWGVALATLLSAAVSFIGFVAIQEFYFGEVWNQALVMRGAICAITLVIAIGVFLGTIKMWQYMLVGALFAPAYALIEWFLGEFVINGVGVTDPGGSILVHMVAAYWGLGVAMAIREKRAFDEPMYTTTHSVTFVWLGSMILWVLWPSFVTALLPADQVTWGLITCYMAGLGSIISAYLVCQIVQKKVNPLIYTYALLAGPVAIGSPLISVSQWGALIIGLVAGVVSALCFIYMQPWLTSKLGVLDAMGVHNLHGMAGWVGALSIVLITGAITNAVAAVIAVIICLITGFIGGLLVRITRGRIGDEMLFTDDSDFTKSEAPVEALSKTASKEVTGGSES
ncbi:MAG: ammonium transporter [Euryarchaeota archaeon]|nr:ammonium transporter [Euryarchaeota archaeon]